jgi:hypothetical protein
VHSATGLPRNVCTSSPPAPARGFGHRQAALCEVLHEAQVEGQLRVRQALEQGEHPGAAIGGDEVVGVLDAGTDRRQLGQHAAARRATKASTSWAPQLGEDRHARVRVGGSEREQLPQAMTADPLGLLRRVAA